MAPQQNRNPQNRRQPSPQQAQQSWQEREYQRLLREEACARREVSRRQLLLEAVSQQLIDLEQRKQDYFSWGYYVKSGLRIFATGGDGRTAQGHDHAKLRFLGDKTRLEMQEKVAVAELKAAEVNLWNCRQDVLIFLGRYHPQAVQQYLQVWGLPTPAVQPPVPVQPAVQPQPTPAGQRILARPVVQQPASVQPQAVPANGTQTQCPKCGNVCAPTANFCGQCQFAFFRPGQQGKQTPVRQPASAKECPQCHRIYASRANFCGTCQGSKLFPASVTGRKQCPQCHRVYAASVTSCGLCRTTLVLVQQPAASSSAQVSQANSDSSELELSEDLIERARQVVAQYGRASISLLQRKLQVGYSRATRLVDLLNAEAQDQGSAGQQQVIQPCAVPPIPPSEIELSDELKQRARQLVARKGRMPKIRILQRELGIGRERAQALFDWFKQDPQAPAEDELEELELRARELLRRYGEEKFSVGLLQRELKTDLGTASQLYNFIML